MAIAMFGDISLNQYMGQIEPYWMDILPETPWHPLILARLSLYLQLSM